MDRFAYQNLADLFDAVRLRHGEKPALNFGNGQILSYADLDACSGRIVASLRAHGVEKGQVVAITGEKQVLTFGAMLACLKLGAAYTVLDPKSPLERQRKILDRCRPAIVLAGGDLCDSFRAVLQAWGGEVIDKDPTAFGEILAGIEPDLADSSYALAGNTPAYIMFTSGS
ncbi:MAG: AMP-binding protein, partial [Verrucomicrobia bacterium]|nr:AMP-binding protein [Verrucomicrobiota bacterium]